MQRISRIATVAQTRLYTSATARAFAPATRNVEEPSSNYRPGKEGFAPGMPHPPGSSPSPAPAPAPRTVADLPEMSKKHDIKANGSPIQKYKLEMTKLRHSYQREHYQGEDVKRVETERHRKGALKRLQASQAKDRAENEKRLAFEKLMQPAGQTRGLDHQAEVAAFVQARKVKRQENFVKAEEKASEKRLESMIRLYHAADDFVTPENIDAKIQEFYETGLNLQSKYYVPKVQDMVADVMDNGGQASHAELLKREQDLKDALNGTVAGGKVGYEGAKAKAESA